MMMRTVKPPPKVNPPRPLLHVMEPKPPVSYEPQPSSSLDFDSDVMEEMRKLEVNIRQMVPEVRDELPQPTNKRDVDQINLKEWRAKGYPSEYAYAKAVGALEIQKPPVNSYIEPAVHVKLNSGEVYDSRDVRKNDRPPHQQQGNRREDLFSREIEHLTDNQNRPPPSMPRKPPQSLASAVPQRLEQEYDDMMSAPPPARQPRVPPVVQTHGITSHLSQSDREKGTLKQRQEEYAQQLARDSAVPKTGSLLDYVGGEGRVQQQGGRPLQQQQQPQQRVNEGLMLGLQEDREKATRRFKQLEYKQQLDAERAAAAASAVSAAPAAERVTLHKARELTPASQSGMMFGLEKEREAQLKRERQEEYRRELDRMRGEAAAAAPGVKGGGGGGSLASYQHQQQQQGRGGGGGDAYFDDNASFGSYDNVSPSYGGGGGNGGAGRGGRSLLDHLGPGAVPPQAAAAGAAARRAAPTAAAAPRGYEMEPSPGKIGGRRRNAGAEAPDTGMLFGLDKESEKNSRRAKQEEYRRQLDQMQSTAATGGAAAVNQRMLQQQQQQQQQQPSRQQKQQQLPSPRNHVPPPPRQSQYQYHAPTPPLPSADDPHRLNGGYHAAAAASSRSPSYPQESEDEEYELLIRQQMEIERKKIALYQQYGKSLDNEEADEEDAYSLSRFAGGGGVNRGAAAAAPQREVRSLEMYSDHRQQQQQADPYDPYNSEEPAVYGRQPGRGVAGGPSPPRAGGRGNRFQEIPDNPYSTRDVGSNQPRVGGVGGGGGGRDANNPLLQHHEPLEENWRPSGAQRVSDAKKQQHQDYQALLNEQVKAAQEAKAAAKRKEQEEDERRTAQIEREAAEQREAERVELERKRAADAKDLLEKQALAEAALARKNKLRRQEQGEGEAEGSVEADSQAVGARGAGKAVAPARVVAAAPPARGGYDGGYGSGAAGAGAGGYGSQDDVSLAEEDSDYGALPRQQQQQQQPRGLGAYLEQRQGRGAAGGSVGGDDDYSLEGGYQSNNNNRGSGMSARGGPTSLSQYRSVDPESAVAPAASAAAGGGGGGGNRGNQSPTKARERLVTDIYGNSNILTGQAEEGDGWKPGGKNKTDRQKAAAAQQRADLEEQMRANAARKEREKREREEELRREREEFDAALQNKNSGNKGGGRGAGRNTAVSDPPPPAAAPAAVASVKASPPPREAPAGGARSRLRDQPVPPSEYEDDPYSNSSSVTAAAAAAPLVRRAPPAPRVQPSVATAGAAASSSSYTSGVSNNPMGSPLSRAVHEADELEERYRRELEEQRYFQFRLQMEREAAAAAAAGSSLDLHRPTSAQDIDSFVSGYNMRQGGAAAVGGGGLPPRRNPTVGQAAAQLHLRNGNYNAPRRPPFYSEEQEESDKEISFASESRLIPINPWAGSDILSSLLPVNVSGESAAGGTRGGGISGGAGGIHRNGGGGGGGRSEINELEKSLASASFMVQLGKRTPADGTRPPPNAAQNMAAAQHQQQQQQLQYARGNSGRNRSDAPPPSSYQQEPRSPERELDSHSHHVTDDDTEMLPHHTTIVEGAGINPDRIAPRELSGGHSRVGSGRAGAGGAAAANVQRASPVVSTAPIVRHVYEGGGPLPSQSSHVDETSADVALSNLIEKANYIIRKEASNPNFEQDLLNEPLNRHYYHNEHEDEVLKKSPSDLARKLADSNARVAEGYNLKPSRDFERQLSETQEDLSNEEPPKNRVFVKQKSGVQQEYIEYY